MKYNAIHFQHLLFSQQPYNRKSLSTVIFFLVYIEITQQRCITQTTKGVSNAAATDVRCISQATRVAGSAAVANDKCVVQATNAAAADKECISQSTMIASNGLMSTEVLEMLEAMPDHDFFI